MVGFSECSGLEINEFRGFELNIRPKRPKVMLRQPYVSELSIKAPNVWELFVGELNVQLPQLGVLQIDACPDLELSVQPRRLNVQLPNVRDLNIRPTGLDVQPAPCGMPGRRFEAECSARAAGHSVETDHTGARADSSSLSPLLSAYVLFS